MRANRPGRAGFILAGGESSRMGQNKALLHLGGEPLILRLARMVRSVTGTAATVVGPPEVYTPLRLRAIRDDWPGAGPLGGIATALRASESQWNLIIACDLPYLSVDWLQYLTRRAQESDCDVVMAITAGGPEPLCAMYRKTGESAIWLALDRGARKVTDALASLRIEYLEPSDWKCFESDGLLFKNMNSSSDYEEAKARFGLRGER